jgi:hypothetical protein
MVNKPSTSSSLAGGFCSFLDALQLLRRKRTAAAIGEKRFPARRPMQC